MTTVLQKSAYILNELGYSSMEVSIDGDMINEIKLSRLEKEHGLRTVHLFYKIKKDIDERNIDAFVEALKPLLKNMYKKEKEEGVFNAITHIRDE